MATEETQTTIPGTTPAGGEGDAAVKAATDAAAAKAKADADAKAARVAAAGKPPTGDTPITIPAGAFRHEVLKETAKALGLSIEEARVLLKDRKRVAETAREAAAEASRKVTEAARGPAPVVPVVTPSRAAGTDPEKEKLRRQNAELEKRLTAQRNKVQKVKVRARDRLLETELRYSAVAAGIKADDADYAMGLYRTKVRSLAAGEDVPAPDDFWPTLKAAKGYLFVDGATAREVPIKPTTAPPASNKPGEVVPPARGAGAPAAGKDVMEMEPDEFGARTSSRYGFRPPQSA